MGKILIFVKQNIVITAIILIATTFRLVGVYPGYPEHTDEAGYSSAVTMILKGDLDPARYDYPAGLPLIHTTIFKSVFIPFYWFKFYLQNLGQIVDGLVKIPLTLEDRKRIFSLNILGPREVNVMYWGRYITAFFGIGVVMGSYFLSKKIFGKKVGLISAFLVAVNFRQVLNSHLGLPDIYNSFFLILTIYSLYKLIENPSKFNYFLSGLFNALYFSIKFQTFGFISLLTAHITVSWKKSETILENIKSIVFSQNLFISMLSSFFVMAFLNPYLFIKFEVFKSVQTYQLSKYGIGSNSFDYFPISYLYHVGIGQEISIFVMLGIILSIAMYFKKSLVLIITITQFMMTFVFLSRGGFYTRNFVTITPVLLIFAAVFIVYVFDIFSKFVKTKWILEFALILFAIMICFGNIKNSIFVMKEYLQPWNRKILASWVTENIPPGSIVSAHPDTPLPVKDVVRMPYEPDEWFSVNEFLKQGSSYAISNSSWSTNSFYWWMNGNLGDLKNLWVKPVDVLEDSYPALAIRELGQFNIYEIHNPWQAPDIDFLVAKLPLYKVEVKNKEVEYNFNASTEGWKKSGTYWAKEDNLDWTNGVLVVRKESASLPSLRWESKPIFADSWGGFKIDYKMKSEADVENLRTGYLFVSFYENYEDANNAKNRIGLRLGERSDGDQSWITKSLVGTIPKDVKYITVNFYNYNTVRSDVSLDDVVVYKANVKLDLQGVKINPTKVDQNNVFLNSHGNL